MKSIAKDSKISIIQAILVLAGLVLHIAYTLLSDPIILSFSDLLEWRITRCLYTLPYIVCFLSCVLSKNRNPRRLAVYSIIAIVISFLPALGGQYIPLYELSLSLSPIIYGIVIATTAFFSLYFAVFISDINKYSYVIYYGFLSSFFIGTSIASVFDDYLISLNAMSFALLIIAVDCYGFKFDYKNQYNPKHYKLLGLDDSNNIRFDYIVDAITDLYLTSELYPNAVKARDFYYAIKYDNKEELSKLNITGRENIKSVFELWSKYESEGYPFNKERTLFFCLCKYMISDKISDEDFDDKFYLFCQTVRTDKNKFGSIEIKPKGKAAADILSNLYDDSFEFDGVTFGSAESFLQGLRFKNVKKQAQVFAMSGKAAKKAGRYHNWYKLTGNLYYKGEKVNRYSEEYDKLITIPFACRYYYNTDGRFRQALLDTGLKTFNHSIGKSEKCETVLTQKELVERLNECKLKAFDEYYLNKNNMEDK